MFLLSLTLLFVLTTAYGQPLSDATGLVHRMEVETGGHSFGIKAVSNFAISDFEFSKDEKKLTLYATGGLENNLSEIIIPRNLVGGNLTFYLNDQKHPAQINSNDEISFILLNFTGSGENKLDIVGTTYLSGLTVQDKVDMGVQKAIKKTDTSDDSFNWVILAGSLAVIAAFVAVKIKKRNSS